MALDSSFANDASFLQDIRTLRGGEEGGNVGENGFPVSWNVALPPSEAVQITAAAYNARDRISPPSDHGKRTVLISADGQARLQTPPALAPMKRVGSCCQRPR